LKDITTKDTFVATHGNDDHHLHKVAQPLPTIRTGFTQKKRLSEDGDFDYTR